MPNQLDEILLDKAQQAMKYGELRCSWSNDPKYVPNGREFEQQTIDAIKQAFVNDGWVKIPQTEIVTRYEANTKPEVIMVNGKEVMTGQEWYDKFTAEYQPWSGFISKDYNDGYADAAIAAFDAAKKAAGVK